MFKRTFKLIALLTILAMTSCSSIEVLNSWEADNVASIESKNILVIARTANDANRKAFEEEMVKQLRAKDLNATESYKKYPKIDHKSKLTKERVEEIKEKFQSDGFNAVVISVLKSTEVVSETTVDGGYETGGSVPTYYGYYGVGFYGYYASPVSYSNFEGVYVEPSISTRTANIYVLETAAYNLDLPEKEQLVVVVTSKIAEPESIIDLADNYAKAVMNSLKK